MNKINQDILKLALLTEFEDIENTPVLLRGNDKQIILVPVVVTVNDGGRIGSISHSSIQSNYNKIVTQIEIDKALMEHVGGNNNE